MLEGGCLCGALRYRSESDPIDAAYCHCSLCQRSTGAPLLASVTVPADGFRYTRGKPRIYRSSAWGQREFCPTCGTQVCYRNTDAATEVDLNTGGLDDPAVFRPRCHIFVGSRLAPMEIADELPRYEDGGPDWRT